MNKHKINYSSGSIPIYGFSMITGARMVEEIDCNAYAPNNYEPKRYVSKIKCKYCNTEYESDKRCPYCNAPNESGA